MIAIDSHKITKTGNFYFIKFYICIFNSRFRRKVFFKFIQKKKKTIFELTRIFFFLNYNFPSAFLKT